MLPKSQLEAYRRYNRRVWEAMGGMKISEELKMQKCQWNDEPVGRYINHFLTSWASRLVEEPLLHPGLVLPIYIMKGKLCNVREALLLTNTQGPGFPMHRDSVPPFDLTLDLCIDHIGTAPRPVTFLQHNDKRGFGIESTTASLEVPTYHSLLHWVFIVFCHAARGSRNISRGGAGSLWT